MRAEIAITGHGAGGTYTLPERSEVDAEDFGGESDALRPGNSVAWANNSRRTHT